MEWITLAVTSKVMKHVASTGDRKQRQLAIQGSSPKVHALLSTARDVHPVLVAVNGMFELSACDTDAIWPKHQTAGFQSADFDSLYDLLSRRPDRAAKFSWEEEA